jgi:hypothetical protein
MKVSRFSDAQEAFILKQGANGVPIGEICRKAGISQAATYFNLEEEVRWPAASRCDRRGAPRRGWPRKVVLNPRMRG